MPLGGPAELARQGRVQVSGTIFSTGFGLVPILK